MNRWVQRFSVFCCLSGSKWSPFDSKQETRLNTNSDCVAERKWHWCDPFEATKIYLASFCEVWNADCVCFFEVFCYLQNSFRLKKGNLMMVLKQTKKWQWSFEHKDKVYTKENSDDFKFWSCGPTSSKVLSFFNVFFNTQQAILWVFGFVFHQKWFNEHSVLF